MISEESCDNEDLSNGCWKFSASTKGINYIKKNFKIENIYFNDTFKYFNLFVFLIK